jgi:hypothetical protein
VTDRSIPFQLGKGTHLRFNRGDIEALETAFSTISGRRIGYPQFPDFLHSLTGQGLFVWRGLKMEAPDGKLIHTFPLNVAGSEEAGDAVFAFIQCGKPGILGGAIADALVATGLWKSKTDSEKQDTSEGVDGPKNSPT